MGEQVGNWRKSTASANGEQCVEVGSGSGNVAVRDTMNRDGHTLSVPDSAWTTFLTTLRYHPADLRSP
jgi:hypothetical protein